MFSKTALTHCKFLGLALLLNACGGTAHTASTIEAAGSAGHGGAGHAGGSHVSAGPAGSETDPDCAKYGDTYDSKPTHGYGSLPASLRGHDGEKQCACHWDAGIGVGLRCQTGYNIQGDHDAPYCAVWLSCRL